MSPSAAAETWLSKVVKRRGGYHWIQLSYTTSKCIVEKYLGVTSSDFSRSIFGVVSFEVEEGGVEGGSVRSKDAPSWTVNCSVLFANDKTIAVFPLDRRPRSGRFTSPQQCGIFYLPCRKVVVYGCRPPQQKHTCSDCSFYRQGTLPSWRCCSCFGKLQWRYTVRCSL